MLYEIIYYSSKVQEEILAFPADVLADFLRISDLLAEFGPELRLPHSRAMGNIKKTQKTPRKELQLAQSRIQEVKHAHTR